MMTKPRPRVVAKLSTKKRMATAVPMEMRSAVRMRGRVAGQITWR